MLLLKIVFFDCLLFKKFPTTCNYAINSHIHAFLNVQFEKKKHSTVERKRKMSIASILINSITHFAISKNYIASVFHHNLVNIYKQKHQLINKSAVVVLHTHRVRMEWHSAKLYPCLPAVALCL